MTHKKPTYQPVTKLPAKLLCGIACALFLLASLCSRADTIEIATHYPNGKISEQYEVNNSDTTYRVGRYKRYDDKGLLVAQGQFSDNVRSGVWTFYKGGSEYERYNFDNFREILFEDRYEEREGCPHFPGGTDELSTYIREVVQKILVADKLTGYHGKKCRITITLSKDGAVANAKVDELANTLRDNKIQDIILAALKNSPKWIPSRRPPKKNTSLDFAIVVQL